MSEENLLEAFGAKVQATEVIRNFGPYREIARRVSFPRQWKALQTIPRAGTPPTQG